MLVSDILAANAARSPERPAVWHKNAWSTYGELDRAANAIAHHLRAIGVSPGDRVGVLMENSADYVAAHFGALKAGAVEVSLNHELRADGLRRLIEHCEARVLIASPRQARKFVGDDGGWPALRHLVVNTDSAIGDPVPPAGCTLHALAEVCAADGAPAGPLDPGRDEHDLAAIVYTSGVTGDPKGVMLTHHNLVSNTRSIVQYLGLLESDRVLVVLPFHYIYGRSLLYSHLFSGGSVVLENRFLFPATVLDTMQQQAATCFAGVPSTFSILLRKTNLRSRSFPILRMVTQAGGGMPPTLQKEVAEAFAPAALYVMYGSTEASPRLTYVEPEMLPHKWGSIGRAIPGVEVFVAGEDGGPLPPGAVGEVAARGPNIMPGYWKDPDGTAKVLRDGVYFTGDLGYADADGYLFLTGRSKDMIKTGGNRVSGKEIEDALLGIEGVVEAAAVGVPDEILGEAIAAFVVSESAALDAQAVLRELGRRLPAYKVPKSIAFLDSLPKSASGKIMKSALAGTASTRHLT